MTEDGRIVAQGLEGPPGESIQGPPGPEGPPGQYGPDDTLTVKELNASQYVTVGEGNTSGTQTGAFAAFQGYFSATREGEGKATFLGYKHTGLEGNKDTTPTALIMNDGAVYFAGGKCGFTKDGEIFFTSRGATWSLMVQGNMVYPEAFDPFEQFRETVEKLD